MQTYFVKSFEEDHSTKTLVGKKKKTFQTLKNILKTETIKPNTKSFGQKQRLSTTILCKNYTKTYRPQGVVFTTKQKPDYVLPFDLVLLSDIKKIIVHYFRIKNNLHIYYNHKLIKGFEKFVFKNIAGMLKKFNSPKIAWKEVNKFRVQNGHSSLSKEKYKLAEYNEAVFYKPVKITPIAIFGYHKKTRIVAKQFNLKYFRSAKEFYERMHNT